MIQTAQNVTIIPPKKQLHNTENPYKQQRVAAYCRVSTEQEEQQNSYQVQIAYYTDLIHQKRNGRWLGYSLTKVSAELRRRKDRSF